jgi:tryptophanyl-tRNA synthetase
MKQRIVSGIKPSGDLHIGNYLGAIAQWTKLQDEYEVMIFIADLHAITVPQEPEELRRRTVEIAKIYLAAGIDPKKVTIFVQSQIHEHAELCWILNTVTRNGDLTKMTQFKDKALVDFDVIEEIRNKASLARKKFNEFNEEYDKKQDLKAALLDVLTFWKSDKPDPIRNLFDIFVASEEALDKFQEMKEQFNSVGVGLFDYPVLMAGDIMMYDAQLVPVGDDQVQHIELARTIGKRFNKRFGEDIFTLPQPLLQKSGARIMALDNPQKKMSKSATSENSYIALNDEPQKARKKIMRAVTDSGTEIVYTDDKPALKNLINIYSLFSGKTTTEIEQLYVGKGYADFKTGLADVVVAFLEDFQRKYAAISDEKVLQVLQEGAHKVRPLAQQKIQTVKKLVGFVL